MRGSMGGWVGGSVGGPVGDRKEAPGSAERRVFVDHSRDAFKPLTLTEPQVNHDVTVGQPA